MSKRVSVRKHTRGPPGSKKNAVKAPKLPKQKKGSKKPKQLKLF